MNLFNFYHRLYSLEKYLLMKEKKIYALMEDIFPMSTSESQINHIM